MDYVTLGRTGLKVSALSLGGGGHSRLGMKTGKAEAESIHIVEKALELGVNLFDSAESYGTEERLGAGLKKAKRDQIYLSTKYSLRANKKLKTPDQLEKSLD